MAYQVEIGPQAQAQFDKLDSTLAASIERKIIWLATNAPTSCIADSSACRNICKDSANYGWAITGFCTGSIRKRN